MGDPPRLHARAQSMMHGNAAARPPGRRMDSGVCSRVVSDTPEAEQRAVLHFWMRRWYN